MMTTKGYAAFAFVFMVQLAFVSSLPTPVVESNSDKYWKELLDNSTKTINEMQKEIAVINGGMNENNWKELKNSLSEKNYKMQKEIEKINVVLKESEGKEAIDNLMKKLNDLQKQIDQINGVLNESTNHYPFIGKQTVDIRGKNSIVTYDVAKFDGDGAFNPKTGLFTAPVKGMYYFAFNGLREKKEFSQATALTVKIVKITSKNYPEVLAEGHMNVWYSDYSYFPIAIQATAQLEKGDSVGVKLMDGWLRSHYDVTTFTGFLIQRMQN